MPANPGTRVMLALVACALGCNAALAYGASQDHATRVQRVTQLIKSAARNSVPGQRKVSVGSTKALLAMSPCPESPAVHLYGHGTHRDARVSCPGNGWQIYVPITIGQTGAIVVATHDLTAGHVIGKSDIKLVPADTVTGSTHSAAHTFSSAVGRSVRAPVGAGSPISLDTLQGAQRVHAGQTLTVRVHSNTVRLKTTAVALQNGRVGQSILVKNPDSGHRYRVMITQHGAVDNLSW